MIVKNLDTNGEKFILNGGCLELSGRKYMSNIRIQLLLTLSRESANGFVWAPYYAKQLESDSVVSCIEKKGWERKVSNSEYKNNGGKLQFKSWSEGMNYL